MGGPLAGSSNSTFEGSDTDLAAQFHWNPETYLEEIRAEVPRFDELQEQAVRAIPFAPSRVLELGMGTGETTRHLLEAYPDAWVIGLDSDPNMVYRLREEYDDVQLARMEDPLEAAALPARPRAVASPGDRRCGQGGETGDADRARL